MNFRTFAFPLVLVLAANVGCVGDAPAQPGTDASTVFDGSANDTGVVDSGSDGGPAVDAGGDAAVDAGPPVAKGDVLWVRTLPSDDAYAAALPTGETLVAGGFTGTNLDFGGTGLSAVGLQDVFLAKLDATGKSTWVVGFGGTGTDQVFAIAVDGAGDVYLAGRTDTGGFKLGTTTMAATSAPFTGWIAKLGGTNGAAQWVHRISTNGTVILCPGIAATGGVVALDCYHNGTTMTWDGGTLANRDTVAPAKFDSAVLAFDATSGAPKWGNGIGSAGADDQTQQLAAGNGLFVVGGQVISGSSTSTVQDTLGSINATRLNTGTGGHALFTALNVTDGKAAWTKLFADSPPSTTESVGGIAAALSTSGKAALIGGDFRGSGNVGQGDMTPNGPVDGFFGSLDVGTKATTWVKVVGGSTTVTYGLEQAQFATSDPWDEPFFVGRVSSTDGKVDGKAISSPANTYEGAFVVKLSPTGTVLWVKGIASSSNFHAVHASTIATTASGESRVAGFWRGTAALDGTNAVSTPNFSTPRGFVVALAP